MRNYLLPTIFMTTIKFICLFLSLALFSCGQKTTKKKVAPAAIELNNRAMTLVSFVKNIDSSKKAIELLDSATTIDTNYYLGYFNKIMFLNRLEQFDKVVITSKNLIRMRPEAHDLYIVCGIFYEKQNDTISSKSYFTQSLRLCNLALDTMKVNNSEYEMFVINKAVNLIMLNRNTESNILLTKLSEIQGNGKMKNITLSMLNLNKKQLIDLYYTYKNSR